MTAKVWFITGCSSGFGAALVREALSRGDKVIATARNASKLSDLKADGADIMSLDVTSPLPELVEKAQEAFKRYGRIDYLVNNAGRSLFTLSCTNSDAAFSGYTQVGGLEELTPAETQAQFDTNVFGLLNVRSHSLPSSARSSD
jgi:NAD(P)-dependent dehydrogenase (short-subunit alcohol dehydrogenase family)